MKKLIYFLALVPVAPALANTNSQCEFQAKVAGIERLATLNETVVANASANSYQNVIRISIEAVVAAKPHPAVCTPHVGKDVTLILKDAEIQKYPVGSKMRVGRSYASSIGSGGVMEFEAWIAK